MMICFRFSFKLNHNYILVGAVAADVELVSLMRCSVLLCKCPIMVRVALQDSNSKFDLCQNVFEHHVHHWLIGISNFVFNQQQAGSGSATRCGNDAGATSAVSMTL